MYYKTTNLTTIELKAEKENALTQEAKIRDLMVLGKKYTPFEVQDLYNAIYKAVPITSVRRAMNTLTNDGFLVKLVGMRQGIYGKPNHTWIKISN